jgi:hypothetical protein
VENTITRPHEAPAPLEVLIDPDIAGALRPLTDDENDGLRIKLMAEGCREKLLYFRLGGACYQLDGHHRRRICEGDKIPFEWHQVKSVTSKQEALEWVHEHQVSRRNSTPEEIKHLRLQRLERVAQARQDGKSLRSIADQENISLGQVQRDLVASGVSPDTPEATTISTIPETVVGKDGKQYDSAKPKLLCPGCQTRQRKGQAMRPTCKECSALRALARSEKKSGANLDADPVSEKPQEGLGNLLSAAANSRRAIKPGQILFDWRSFYNDFGALVRQVDRFGRVYRLQEKDKREFSCLLEQLFEMFKHWYRELTKEEPPAPWSAITPPREIDDL